MQTPSFSHPEEEFACKRFKYLGGTGKLWFILGRLMWETHIMVPALFCFVLAGMTEIFWGATGGFCFGEGSQCVAQG